MKYTLYYAEGSAAMGVRVILEEIGASYNLIESSIDMDQPRTAEFLALNPNGWVPVLVWEHGSIYECGAITTFLCDRHPETELAPGPEGLVSAMAVLFFQFHSKCLPDDLLPFPVLQFGSGLCECQEPVSSPAE